MKMRKRKAYSDITEPMGEPSVIDRDVNYGHTTRRKANVYDAIAGTTPRETPLGTMN